MLQSGGISTSAGAAFGAREGIDRYKPHIDGLRAVSIAAVIGYHAHVPGFGGGFVGVDLFFVISGFLIINQIVSSLGDGRFSIWDFYARRALRILPPFLPVLVVTLACAIAMIASSRAMESYVLSAALSPAFLSNVYFFIKNDYFDLYADQKPVLHTWSLSVEEQFYLVTPLLLVGLFWLARRRGWSIGGVLAAFGVAIGIASFVGCVAFTTESANAAFFLVQWRAWEFVAGGAVATLAGLMQRWRPAWLGPLCGAAGLLLVGHAILTFGGVRLFPGFAAASPVLGAVLIAVSGIVAPANPVAALLSLRPLLFVGRISYALYLWHWPLLVFGGMLSFAFPAPLIRTAAIALAVVLSIATHYGIERPVVAWRKRSGLAGNHLLARKIVLWAIAGCAAVMVLTGGLGGYAYLRLTQSEDPLLAPALAAKVDPDWSCRQPIGASEAACFDGKTPLGVIAGDSHAIAMADRIAWEAGQQGVKLMALTRGGCNQMGLIDVPDGATRHPLCAQIARQLDYYLPKLAGKARFAILTARWNAAIEGPSGAFPDGDRAAAEAQAQLRRDLENWIRVVGEEGQRPVLIIGPVPEFRQADPATCISLARTLGRPETGCSLPRAEVEARRRRTVDALRQAVAASANARFVDPIDRFCGPASCLPVQDGAVAYLDDTHLNAFGAKLLFERFREDFLWAFQGDATAEPGSPAR